MLITYVTEENENDLEQSYILNAYQFPKEIGKCTTD